MPRAASTLIALGLAALVHIGGVATVPQFSALFDLLLVVVVWNARHGEPVAGALGGSAAGLLTDALAGAPFGLYGFSDTLVGVAVARVAQQLVIERSSGILLVFTLASALQQALLAGLALLVVPSATFPAAPFMIAKAATTGLIGLIVARGERLFVQQRAARRSRRSTSLRPPGAR